MGPDEVTSKVQQVYETTLVRAFFVEIDTNHRFRSFIFEIRSRMGPFGVILTNSICLLPLLKAYATLPFKFISSSCPQGIPPYVL